MLILNGINLETGLAGAAMDKFLIFIIFLFFLLGCQNNINKDADLIASINENLTSEKSGGVASLGIEDGISKSLEDIDLIEGVDARSVKKFRIKSENRGFYPSVIDVNFNDYVLLEITSVDYTYDISSDDFNFERTVLNPGETKNIGFVADKLGNFRLVCTLQCQPRADMNILVIVK